MINALTIDVEEWFCVSNYQSAIARQDWDRLPSRVEAATREILNILAEHTTRATFFVLGWVAERHPALIRDIAAGGHEIASHGYGHQLVYDLAPEEFATDLARSLEAIRSAAGCECAGYRAPSFSLRTDTAWMWETLTQAGIWYDSSIFPVTHDRYGEPQAPRFPFVVHGGSARIVEFPLSTMRVAGRNIPVAGGGYLRLYPLTVTRRAIGRLNRQGQPAMVYLHPWELDPGQPRPAVSRLRLWRHRVGMASVAGKLHALLGQFRFGPVREVLDRGANGTYADYLAQLDGSGQAKTACGPLN